MQALAPYAVDLRSAVQWAAEISACWRQSIQGIVETGRLIAAAKHALPYGEFLAMIEGELPFGARTAQRLMRIADDPRLSDATHVSHLPASWGTLFELTKLDDDEFEDKIADGTIRPDMHRRDLTPEPATLRPAVEFAADPPSTPLPYGARAIMGSRQEPDDSLDYFPTPPIATRALMEHVLPQIGGTGRWQTVWEPAAGEGHIAEVLCEYFDDVMASDIRDYGYSRVHEKWETADFLSYADGHKIADWIITNPPFKDDAEAFVLNALKLAKVGVAMFFRLQWLETIGRYERIFKPFPPAIIAQFAERVPLHKGRWEPDGGTATAYLWIVWLPARTEATGRTEFFWIPPGCREALSKPDDRERFTTHPVTRRIGTTADDGSPTDPVTGEIAEAEIPDFARSVAGQTKGHEAP